jgi:Kef-type K+ transport system membrane component KefB
MNTRGLMELIALNIGLDVGVISPTVFTIMVLMALVTTFMTSPLPEWVYSAKPMPVEENMVEENKETSRRTAVA